MRKRIICSIIALTAVLAIFAQGGTKSPYSQYGIGVLSDQSQGFNRGMNGVGLALRRGNISNTINPASYSAIDSLTMIFDIGMSAQMTNYKEQGASVNDRSAYFEYAVGTFRLLKGVGVSFGVLPYSSIGYNYSTGNYLDANNGTIYETYSGTGGLHQVFVGVGWRVLKPLSIGVNMAYLWGSYNRLATSSSTTYINSLSKKYTANVNNYNLEMGLQWEQPVGRKDVLTLGATMALGHKLGADPTCMIVNTNSVTSSQDTTTFVVENGLKLPFSYGVGLGWTHERRLFVGADASLQKWGSVSFPEYDSQNKTYALASGVLKDRYRVSIGADYVPAAPGSMKRSYFSNIHYRLGAGYATPYYYINGKDGPKELSVSAGLGLPLQNGWNNRGNMRPVLNISAQWVHNSAKDMVTENSFRINIGLTFNERWFAKWKVD